MTATILISILLAAVCGLILRSRIQHKKAGKSSCGCGCGNCAMSDMCHGKK